MTNNIKYSWFINQKGTKRAKRMRIKYSKKYNKVNMILENSKIYGIELSEITKNMIEEKKKFYGKQMSKLQTFEWQFKQRGRDEALRLIEGHFTKEELSKNKTEGGILKILRKIF